MSNILTIRSVALSKTTQASWKASGAIVFRRRNRETVWDQRFHSTTTYQAVLNLGNTDMSFEGIPVPVFNPPELVFGISSPVALRRQIPELLPQATIMGPHWHKRSGMKGQGKQFHPGTEGQCPVMGGDTQAHIEGTEYRIITVNNTIVQATRKHGTAPNFEFEWVGVEGISKGGFIPLLKEATETIAHFGNSVIGWDVIHNGNRPFIIEANTSPGVNDATAQRIVDQIRKVI